MLKKLLALMLVIVALVSLMPRTGQAQDSRGFFRDGQDNAGLERRSGFRYPLPVQQIPFISYVASGTQTVGTATAVRIATLAADARAVDVGAIGGALNYGNESVPTGEAWPHFIASGSYKTFYVATQTPAIYLRGRTATTTCDRLEY